jgi:hypothetical protein
MYDSHVGMSAYPNKRVDQLLLHMVFHGTFGHGAKGAFSTDLALYGEAGGTRAIVRHGNIEIEKFSKAGKADSVFAGRVPANSTRCGLRKWKTRDTDRHTLAAPHLNVNVVVTTLKVMYRVQLAAARRLRMSLRRKCGTWKSWD